MPVATEDFWGAAATGVGKPPKEETAVRRMWRRGLRYGELAVGGDAVECRQVDRRARGTLVRLMVAGFFVLSG
jgi:hypothetical protein